MFDMFNFTADTVEMTDFTVLSVVVVCKSICRKFVLKTTYIQGVLPTTY